MEPAKTILTNAKFSSIFLAIFVLFVSALSSANAKIHEHKFVVRS